MKDIERNRRDPPSINDDIALATWLPEKDCVTGVL